MNISFFLRNNNPKKDPNGNPVKKWKPIKPQMIKANFRFNGERYSLNTGKKIDTELWSTDKQTVLTGFKFHKEYNSFLKDYKFQLEKMVNELHGKKIRIYQEGLQEQMDALYKVDKTEVDSTSNQDFISFIKGAIKANTEIKQGTITNYNQLVKHLILAYKLAPKAEIETYNKLSIKAKGKTEIKRNKYLEFDSIDATLIEKFKAYMLTATYTINKDGVPTEIYYNNNNIAKTIKYLKHFLRLAINSHLIKPIEVSKIKIKTFDTESVYTDMNELQMFCELRLNDDLTLKHTRDMYVVNSIIGGLRFSDLKRLSKPNFYYKVIKNKEQLVYRFTTKKTQVTLELPVNEMAQTILEEYNFNLPKISHKHFNKSIKKVAQLAGLTNIMKWTEMRGNKVIEFEAPKFERIASHTSRRSFATNMYDEGVKVKFIMAFTGHKTESEFFKYIKRKEEFNIEELAEQINRIKPIKVSSKKSQAFALGA